MADTKVIVIPEGKICDYIDGKFRNDTPEEYVRQTVEKRLVNEHKYFPEQIRVEYTLQLGSRKPRADIIIFESKDTAQTQENIKIIIECKKETVDARNAKDGVEQLKSYMSACPNCEWGMWTNGRQKEVFRKYVNDKGQIDFMDYNDIPSADGNLEDINRPSRASLKNAYDDNLLFTFKTCHNHIYVNDVLLANGGSKYLFKYKIEENQIVYSFDDNGDTVIRKSEIFTDVLSGEKTAFINVPLAYLYHDEVVNPRGINSSIRLLIKEFYKSNPQLHLSLARIEDERIKIFDGQHKAVAQIVLGVKSIVVRLFINPDLDRLIETNTNAGSKLKQIAFDKAIVRQLHDTLYSERLRKYQQDHFLDEDNWVQYLRLLIKNHFAFAGTMYNEDNLFQQRIPDQLWENIRTFIINLKNLPVWKDRSMAATIFGGKNKYDFWKIIFQTGKTSDGTQVLVVPLNVADMIKK